MESSARSWFTRRLCSRRNNVCHEINMIFWLTRGCERKTRTHHGTSQVKPRLRHKACHNTRKNKNFGEQGMWAVVRGHPETTSQQNVMRGWLGRIFSPRSRSAGITLCDKDGGRDDDCFSRTITLTFGFKAQAAWIAMYRTLSKIKVHQSCSFRHGLSETLIISLGTKLI